MKVKIKPDGTMLAVYDDRLPLSKLGTFEINRASNVEFNHICGMWEARDCQTGELLCFDPSRNECLAKERQVIEGRL